MSDNKLVIGTRASQLAKQQASEIAAELQQLWAGENITVETKLIETTGDKILDQPLAQIEGKGVFLKEIERALLQNEIDLAVHSLKDVPTELPSGLKLAALPRRADPRDVLVAEEYENLQELPAGARVGTGSKRRRTQLLQRRSDLEVTSVRGNVDTRLQKLHKQDFQAIVLAAAGLKRLGLSQHISCYFSPCQFVPAAGQGGLAVEIQSDNSWLETQLKKLEDKNTVSCLKAERTLLNRLGGGCHVPIGCYARVVEDEIEVYGLVGDGEGRKTIRENLSGDVDKAEKIAAELADKLLKLGAADLLEGEV